MTPWRRLARDGARTAFASASTEPTIVFATGSRAAPSLSPRARDASSDDFVDSDVHARLRASRSASTSAPGARALPRRSLVTSFGRSFRAPPSFASSSSSSSSCWSSSRGYRASPASLDDSSSSPSAPLDTGAPPPGAHDDEHGKTPRSAFTDRMKRAIEGKDHRSALAAFDEMCRVYPDNQGVLAYELLIRLAANAGDPDAALDALEAMLTVGYAPRASTHGKIILACNRAGDLARGVEWLDGVLASEPADFAKTPAAAKHLFEKVLMGAAMRADAEVFKETLAKMHRLGAAFGEGALEATLLMESKIGDAGSLEAAWAAPRFAASAPHPRSPRLLCRRVEAHARCATYLIRRRDVAKGGRTRGGREDAGGVEGDDAMVRAEARRSRVAASEALDELYAATSEATAFATKVSHPRDVRDATTALAGAYAVVGDSDAIRALMERAAAVGVAPDQHVFNALLRSEACARREDEDEDKDEDAAASEEEGSSGASGSPASSASDGFGGSSLSHHGVDALPSMTNAHAIERSRRRRAVLRVEALMRDMVESGAEPDLHSFMALLSAYAKTGDVRACSDALVGMRARNIPLDQWAFNALLGACAAAGDVDAATRTREEMRRAGVPADDVTFAALFDACAGAGKRLRGIQRVFSEDEVDAFDDASWDDWDDWGSPAATSVSSSRAALAGALAESEKDNREKGKASDASSSSSSSSGSSSSSSSSSRMVPSLGGGPVSAFGEAAKAAAKAAREGLSSASALMEGGASTGLASGEEGALQSSSLWGDPAAGGGGRSVYGGGPAAETARAIKALGEFRRDAERSAEKSSSAGTHPFSNPRVVTSLVGAYGALGEFDDMMATLRNPPGGGGADAHAYTQALHSLALGGAPAAGNDDAGAGKKTHPAARGGEGGAKRRVASGPAAALALADEMEHALGIRPTRVTLACCLLACAKMRDFSRAKARFDAHAEKGYEIGADSFDGLFKAAHAGGAFARVAGSVADAMERARVAPDAHVEATLRRAGSVGNGAERKVADAILRRFGLVDDAEAARSVQSASEAF